ncbi:hypothetical protein BT63DRAFT_419952 [Microthyrium microscopicum]|uniref:BTB domain-containing protein n=1 Tax=Microthyrium microscopicum TaxID=703497 RepID=A0A6A6USE1_9PEZI|nr:hypothetical protein BT63DRAFT_419952 [Microthyrium microscopicum]
MVSYPDDHSMSSSTLPGGYRPSRAPSVASGRSSVTLRPSRHSQRHERHGYSKSHAGVTTASSSSSGHGTLNEFPTFDRTGDVDIILKNGRKEQRFTLHRLYLAQCSGWFEDVLGIGDGADSPGSSSSRAPVGKRKIRFELDWTKGVDDPMPMLILKPSSSPISTDQSHPPPLRPKPPAPSNGFFRSMTNFSALHINQPAPEPGDDVLRTYSNLFRIFYNHEPILDKTNIAVAYTECKSLLQLAAAYEALQVIGPRVDHHLLRFGSRLWKQIAKYPPSYLKLGYLARSRAIFGEALIHVVGTWPTSENALRGQVPPHVLDLVEDKVDELDEQRRRIEAKLWRLNLTTSRGERVGPSVSWLDWLVVSLWRQWFAENTTPGPVGILKDSGSRSSSTSRARPSTSRASAPPLNPQLAIARIFRLVGLGGQAYLPHDEIKRFLKCSPELYSRDNLKRAERRLEELKNVARDAVQPLTRNFLELDASTGVNYLTCTRVADGEWPWED